MASTIALSWILRALTFRERRQCVQTSDGLRPPEGIRRLQLYRHWFSRGGRDPDGWPRFLAENEISEADLLKILGSDQPIILPKWTVTLSELVDELQRRKSPFRQGRSAAENIALPVATYAWRHLRDTSRVDLDSFASQEAISALQRALTFRFARLNSQVIKDLVPSDGPCVKATGNGQSKTSLTVTSETVALQVLQTYPALGRLWAVNVENWSRFIRDFVVHAKTFSKGQGISKNGRYVIETIDPDLSDFHHKGRTVMRVRFANGKDWFYKPRSTTLESQWFALLRWLNRAGFGTPFKVIKVICRKNHSWMEAVAPRQCENRKEATMYYRRAGAILYLLYLLRGVDVHADNIIALGGDPVLIDCETLLHPTIRISKEVTQAEEGSILRTGMLPISQGSSQSQDTSALGKMLGSHSVRLEDQQMQPRDFVDSIIEGFCDIDAFIRPRAARFQQALGRVRSHSCRHIYRPTMSYGSIMNESLSPALLRDGFDRSLFLLAFCHDGLVPRRIVRSELVALERGDIPMVYGRASRPLQLPTKRMINEMLEEIRQALASN